MSWILLFLFTTLGHGEQTTAPSWVTQLRAAGIDGYLSQDHTQYALRGPLGDIAPGAVEAFPYLEDIWPALTQIVHQTGVQVILTQPPRHGRGMVFAAMVDDIEGQLTLLLTPFAHRRILMHELTHIVDFRSGFPQTFSAQLKALGFNDADAGTLTRYAMELRALADFASLGYEATPFDVHEAEVLYRHYARDAQGVLARQPFTLTMKFETLMRSYGMTLPKHVGSCSAALMVIATGASK